MFGNDILISIPNFSQKMKTNCNRNIFIIFRLGDDCAEEYKNCDIDPKSKKRKETAEGKSIRAVLYTKRYIDAAFALVKTIKNCRDDILMDNLVHSLSFIYNLLKEFCAEFTQIMCPQNWSGFERVFYPRLVQMRHHDAWVWLVKIIRLGRRIKKYIQGCTDIPVLNFYVRLSHTLNYFLVETKKCHPYFFSKPHQNIMQHNVGKMRRIFDYI